MAGTIKLTVNGATVVVDEQPGEMLADLLRSRLRLTGTKIGCNELECGVCTVLVDGRPVLSCGYPASKAPGKEVITIEGLGKMQPPSTGIHPLQDAFVKYGAVQCGFCTPGQLMTAYALLRENPDPSEEDIKVALKDTLCRCGGYSGIIRAVRAAARSLKDGVPVGLPPDIPQSRIPHRSVGKLVPRMDGIDKVTGKAIYTDDLAFPGMLHARVKRAMVPSAVVRKIDVSRAKALPGVAAVLTAPDIPGDHNHGIIVQDWPILVGVGEKVRTVGDALALVAAETRDIASRALALIDVEFDPLPGRQRSAGGASILCSRHPSERQPAQAHRGEKGGRGARLCGGRRGPRSYFPHPFVRSCFSGTGVQHRPSHVRGTHGGVRRFSDPLRRSTTGRGRPRSSREPGARCRPVDRGRFRRQRGHRRADTRRLARSGHSEAGEASFSIGAKASWCIPNAMQRRSASRSVRRGREDSPRVKPSCTGTPEPTLHSGRK